MLWLICWMIYLFFYELSSIALSYFCFLTRWGRETWPDRDRPLQSSSPFPLMNLPAFHPTTHGCLSSLPSTGPPLLVFSFLCSDVLPACLLSLPTTLPETHTHVRTHTRARTQVHDCPTYFCSSKARLDELKRMQQNVWWNKTKNHL